MAGVACFVSLASAARADEAVDWKARGDAAMEAGRAAEALDAYERAKKASPLPALDYNRGRAMLALGDFAGALEAFETFTKNASPELREKTSRLPEVMAELSAKVVYVRITCARCTDSSELRLRGRTLVVGTELRTNPGPAELTVATRGFLPYRRTLDLAPGEHLTFEAPLEAEPTTGRVVLRIVPASALVSVDGGRRMPLPHAMDLAPGLHELRFEAEGHDSRAVSLVIERGKERSLDVGLPTKAPSIFARPWFWAVVGAAVVTATTVAIVAGTQQRGLDEGSLGSYRLP
jgi:tetratricopeptide (TPR) repeat protein